VLKSLLTLWAALSCVSVALAQSPHFVRADATIDRQTGDLIVSWKEAGLGANTLIEYTLSGSASVGYACINKGGKHPQASNKETVNGPVDASARSLRGETAASRRVWFWNHLMPVTSLVQPATGWSWPMSPLKTWP
jgi:hypothetical protein